MQYAKIRLVMVSSLRRYLATGSFALILYTMFAYSRSFPEIILAFIIPFSILSYKEAEIGFLMIFISFISSLAAVKLNHASITHSFLMLVAVILFYAIKAALERKKVVKINELNSLAEKYRKDLSNIDSEIRFYNDYILKKQRLIEQRKKLLSLLKDIENSQTEEETISKLTKSIKMLYPDASYLFIVSPYTSPAVDDVFRTKTPLFIPSTSKDTRYPKGIWSERENSIIMIPLIVFSKTTAVISLSASKDNYFTKDDFIILEIIANTASTTMENISLYRNLDNLARKDPLTGVFTRRIFDEKIEEEILVSARTRQPFCLFIMDIDHFKRINDTYGHQAGDEVLKQVAQLASKNIREFDFISRYGGEEFAIIMPNTSKREAILIAKRIADEIRNTHFPFLKKEQRITISGGIGEFPSEAQSKTQIIRTCDERLYKAKNSGRDRIVYE